MSVAALGAWGVRAASAFGSRGLERVVVAAVLATTAAVAESLALGTVGLGASPLPLTAAALATWLAGKRWLPRVEVAPSAELTAGWQRLRPLERAALGAAAGAAIAWAAYLVRHPVVGADGVQYYLPEVVDWVGSGRPGSTDPVSYLFPFTEYPATNYVALAWQMGISGSFLPAGPWMVGMLALLVVAGWVGLRALEVPKAVAALSIATLASTPVLVAQVQGPLTDLPALTWAICAAALCARAKHRTALLAPALIAAALAIGTKPTVGFFVVVVLAAAFWTHRHRLRPVRWVLGGALVASIVAGGGWYIRLLLVHGSPLWPYGPALGDAPPGFIDRASGTFLARPGETLRGNVSVYLSGLAGGVAVVAAGIAAPLLIRKREVIAGAVVTAFGLLLWSVTPFTGIPDGVPNEWIGILAGAVVNTTRYLPPVIAAAITTLALVARHGGWGRSVAITALLVGLVWSLLEDLQRGSADQVPSKLVLLAGAVLGLVVTAAVSRPPTLPGPPIAKVGLTALIVGVLIGINVPGALRRHADEGFRFPKGYFALARWAGSTSAYADDSRAVAMAPRLLGPLAGDRLQHRLRLIPADEPCGRVAARAATEWVLIEDAPLLRSLHPYTAGKCLRDRRPTFRTGAFRLYAPTGSAASPP